MFNKMGYLTVKKDLTKLKLGGGKHEEKKNSNNTYSTNPWPTSSFNSLRT